MLKDAMLKSNLMKNKFHCMLVTPKILSTQFYLAWQGGLLFNMAKILFFFFYAIS